MAKGKDKEIVEDVVEKDVVEKDVVEKDVEEKDVVEKDVEGSKPEGENEAPKVIEIVMGQVFGTSRLKMHDRPGGGKTVIKKLLLKGDVIKVNISDSTENYYKVVYGDKPREVEGYSLKKYIQV